MRWRSCWATGPYTPFKGRITFADAEYNTQTGTFLIRATIPNKKDILRPGQFVRAHLLGAIRPKAILVPLRAVQQGSKGHFVWVVTKEGKAGSQAGGGRGLGGERLVYQRRAHCRRPGGSGRWSYASARCACRCQDAGTRRSIRGGRGRHTQGGACKTRSRQEREIREGPGHDIPPSSSLRGRYSPPLSPLS